MSYVPPKPATAPVQASHSFVDRIVGAIKLSRPIYDEVRRDPSAMMQAAGIVGVTGLLAGISQGAAARGETFEVDGRIYEMPDSALFPLAGGITIALLSLVVWVLLSVLFRFVGTRLLKSPASDLQWQEVARPLGFASAPSLLLILTPIPVIGFIVANFLWIWSLATQLVSMSETFRVSKLRAFAIFLVSSLGLAFILAPIVCIVIVVADAVF
jgi:hypothetical protein